MKRIVLSLAALVLISGYYPVMAADLPGTGKKSALTPVAVAPGPIYAFGHIGVGWSTQESELTLQGINVTSLVSGAPKAFPTGFMIGGGVGAGGNLLYGYGGVEIEANYDFTRASSGCVAGLGCLGYSKNSFLFAQKAFWTPMQTPLAFTGWSWTQNLTVLPIIGVAERTVDGCLLDTAGGSVCDTKWLVGFLAGAQLRIPVSPSAHIRFEWDYIKYNESITHADSAVFGLSNTLKYDAEQRATIGVGISF